MPRELADWLVAYHGDNHRRLQRIKAAVDPGDFFAFPQSIPPERGPVRRGYGPSGER
ncbi:BBE domain-containing protein [Saccharopolyspora sp. CA-218241]|uniref:BBE domain-containing protein n=1 Tax=Saccharopolyspora sp. CA-218241 TaxID=3240027 RepID=UPI003D97AC5F